MCWRSMACPKLKIAEEDMKVYKIMLDEGAITELKSFYQLKVYKIGKKYAEKIKIERPNYLWSFYAIRNGFHSYSGEMTELIKYDGFWVIRSNFDNSYLDEIQIFEEVRSVEDIVAVECIIPKGSMYCENMYGEIVSDCIIITSKKKNNFKKWLKYFV